MKALLLLFVLPSLTCLAGSNSADTDRLRDGKAIFLDRDRGHCLLCHQVKQINEPFQGTIGTDLSDVGSRLNADQLRARIVDPTLVNPDTVMPAYHRTRDLRQVAEEYINLPILTTDEVDNLVIFVQSLVQDGDNN